MRRSRYSFAVLMVLFSAGITLAQASYQNPVIKKPGINAEVADPFVLKFNGEYYLYTSGDPITAYHSTDLVNWEYVGPVLSSSKDPNAWNQADVWAPEVVYRDGKFYMYYSASRKSEDWRVGEMARRIGVAVSDDPKGPFVDSGAPLTPGWGIDGTVFKDPDSGEEFLFYSYLYEPRLPGAGIVADKFIALNRLSGHPSHVTRGSEAWEDKDGDPNNGSLRYTNEGPTVTKRYGRFYMMYSGGSWDRPTYALGYATSDAVMQGGLDGPGWTKVVPPILRSTPIADAPGHNTLVKAPNNVDDINIYHARAVPFLEPWNRMPFADRLYWNHERMFALPPTTGDMAPPDRPVFATSGAGHDAAMAAQFARGDNVSVLPNAGQFRNFVYEVNLKLLPPKQGVAHGSAGAIVFHKDKDNEIRVSLASNQIALEGKLGGKAIDPATHPFVTPLVPNVLHQLMITRNGGTFRVQLDGVNVLHGETAAGQSAAGFGIYTAGQPAQFGYSALTPAFEDTFDVSQHDWVVKNGTWLVDEGALNQVAAGESRAIALKGEAAMDYEITASVRLRDVDSLSSKVGIVAATSANGVSVLAGFDKNIWPFARFWVQKIAGGGTVQESFAVPTPRGFDYAQYHTIRAVKQGSAFTFFLDGQEIAAHRFNADEAQAGLFTESARAAFDTVARKQIMVAQSLLLNGSFETEQWEGTAPSKDNPWIFAGGARANECCAHTGVRRLIVIGKDGSAEQTVSGLSTGHYTLHAWISTSGDAQAEMSVTSGTRQGSQVSGQSEGWKKLSLDFDVPAGETSAVIRFAGHPKAVDSFVAADDFYLFRR